MVHMMPPRLKGRDAGEKIAKITLASGVTLRKSRRGHHLDG